MRFLLCFSKLLDSMLREFAVSPGKLRCEANIDDRWSRVIQAPFFAPFFSGVRGGDDLRLDGWLCQLRTSYAANGLSKPFKVSSP
ncbi:MAG: hypothetical protein WBL86_26265, partial [Pseudolabrys sp.]